MNLIDDRITTQATHCAPLLKPLTSTPTHLSKVLNTKQILSLENAERLATLLKLSDEDRKSFILSAAEEKRCHLVLKVAPDLTDCPN